MKTNVVPDTDKECTDITTRETIPLNQQMLDHFGQLSRVALDILGGLSNVHALSKRSFRCYGLENQPGYNSKVLNREKHYILTIIDF